MDIKRLYFIMTLIVFSFILSFTTIGCSATGPLLRPTINSREEYIMSHPELSLEIKRAILEGRVIKGMTKDDVRASWGGPSKIDDFSSDPNAWWYDENGEGWWYKAFPLSFEPTRFVKFKKGLVDYISEDYK